MLVSAFYVLNLYDRVIAYSLHETRVEQAKQVFLEKNFKFHHKLSICESKWWILLQAFCLVNIF